jgi:hypothetical protein
LTPVVPASKVAKQIKNFFMLMIFYDLILTRVLFAAASVT